MNDTTTSVVRIHRVTRARRNHYSAQPDADRGQIGTRLTKSMCGAGGYWQVGALRVRRWDEWMKATDCSACVRAAAGRAALTEGTDSA